MQTQNLKAVVIGRHIPDFGTLQVEVVETINVTFPATGKETLPVLMDLTKKAVEAGAVLLFQNVPAPLAGALILFMRKYQVHLEYAQVGNSWPMPKIGVVVSVPAAMPGKPEEGEFRLLEYQESEIDEAAFVAAIKLVNPRAKVEKIDGRTFKVTGDAPRPFVFDHIEWFDTGNS